MALPFARGVPSPAAGGGSGATGGDEQGAEMAGIGNRVALGAAGALLAATLAAGAGPGAGRVGALAETAPTPTGTPASVAAETLSLGGWAFDLDPGEALVVYVTARNEDLGGATLRLQPFARTTDGFVPLPSFETAASGRLAGAAVGDALVLDGVEQRAGGGR